jgi:death-on-curing protein
MEYLSAEDILNIHSVIIDETGGAHGIREAHAIKTLADLPKQEAFGRELYGSLETKAALYIRNIINSHPFIDGNKRSAMGCADAFLQLNGSIIVAKKGQIEAFALEVTNKHLTLEQIAAWLKKNCTKIPNAI